MTTTPMRVPALMALAVHRAMSAPEWARAVGDPDERAWLLVRALCEELHPEGAFQVPSVFALEAWLERDDRNERIRTEFDGSNYDVLARRNRLSKRQVRRIVDSPRHEGGGAED